MDLVTCYVANGYGFGLNVDAAEVVRQPAVRVLPLDGFPALEMVALWHGEPTPVIRRMLAESQRYIAQQWPSRASAGPLPDQ